jgi:hypothetical protein
VKRGGSLSFLTIFIFGVPELLNFKKERDPPLSTSKQLIKF